LNGDMMRQNPFKPIYDLCNAGNSREKLKHLPDFPRYIDVELTNTCNFHCLMCPTGVGSQKRAKGFMSDDIYRKLIDEVKERHTPLRFIRWGEPSLHPKFSQYLEDAKKHDLPVHINTNGKLLNEDILRKLVDLPLDSIKFSFQGVDRNSYRQMRNTDYFDELFKKIKLLHSLRGDRPSPFIHVATTITIESPEIVAHFKETAGRFADLVTIGRTQLEYLDLAKVKLSEEEIKTLTALKLQETLIKKHPECPEVFDKLSINWDGKVTACCKDYDEKMVIGDLRNQSLQEIWSSEQMFQYRRLLADMRHDDIELCSICFDTMGIGKKLNTV